MVMHGKGAVGLHLNDFLAAKFDKSMVEVEAKQLAEQDPERSVHATRAAASRHGGGRSDARRGRL